MTDSVAEYIRAGGDPAEAMIRMLIDCEHDYINYDHPSFIGGPNAVAEILSNPKVRRQSHSDLGGQESTDGIGEDAPRSAKPDSIIQGSSARNTRTNKGDTNTSSTSAPMLGLKVCSSTH